MTNVVEFRKPTVPSVAAAPVAEDRHYWIHDLSSAAYTAAFVDGDMEAGDLLLAELSGMLKAKTPFCRLSPDIRERCAAPLGISGEAFRERSAKLLDIIYR